MKTLFITITILLLLYGNIYAQRLDTGYVEFIHINVIDKKFENLVPLLKNKLSDEIIRFQFQMQKYPDIEIELHIAPDKVTYDTWREQYNVTITDSGGFAVSESNKIFIANQRQSITNDSVIRTILHEYIHLFIYHYFSDAPLWFHEGMAIYFSRQMSFSYAFQFITDHAFHREYLLIKYAYNYPANIANIEPFYYQSYSIIKKIVEDKPANIVNLFEASEKYSATVGAGFQPTRNHFEQAFTSVFYKTPEDYLTVFEKDMNTFFKRNLYLGIMMLTWLLFPIFLIIAKIKQNKKAKELLEKWEAEDMEVIAQ